MTFELADHPAAVWRPGAEHERTAMNTFVAPGTVVEGEFGLFDNVLAPGQGAVPHFHTGFSESFYILEGSLSLRAGDVTRTVVPGDFVYVPPTGIHVFRNDGDVDTRFLLIFSPGAPREQYFREMAELFSRETPVTQEEVDDVAARHDQINVHDPRWALS